LVPAEQETPPLIRGRQSHRKGGSRPQNLGYNQRTIEKDQKKKLPTVPKSTSKTQQRQSKRSVRKSQTRRIKKRKGKEGGKGERGEYSTTESAPWRRQKLHKEGAAKKQSPPMKTGVERLPTSEGSVINTGSGRVQRQGRRQKREG